mgnify:CR=1 FL=1
MGTDRPFTFDAVYGMESQQEVRNVALRLVVPGA